MRYKKRDKSINDHHQRSYLLKLSNHTENDNRELYLFHPPSQLEMTFDKVSYSYLAERGHIFNYS